MSISDRVRVRARVANTTTHTAISCAVRKLLLHHRWKQSATAATVRIAGSSTATEHTLEDAAQLVR